MKTIIATLLASASLASAITITINSDTPTGLEFTLDWSNSRIDSWDKEFGPNGSSVEWMGPIGRNQYFSFIEIHAACDPNIHGFGIQFWSDPEYYGPVQTALGSPNIHFMPPNVPLGIYALDNTVYGARFVYGQPVPDVDSGAVLMAIGLAGIALVRRLELS